MANPRFTLKESPFHFLVTVIEVIRIKHCLHISGEKIHDLNLLHNGGSRKEGLQKTIPCWCAWSGVGMGNLWGLSPQIPLQERLEEGSLPTIIIPACIL